MKFFGICAALALLFWCSRDPAKDEPKLVQDVCNNDSPTSCWYDFAKNTCHDAPECFHTYGRKKCRDDDARCWADFYNLDARVYCKESIERLSRYAVQWNGTFGLLHFKIAKWADQEHKVLTLAGDDLAVQNEYGAEENHMYRCDLDIATGRPVDARIAPGRL